LSAHLEVLLAGLVLVPEERIKPITAQTLPACVIGSRFVAILPLGRIALEAIAHPASAKA
jgi:hypothetical protein